MDDIGIENVSSTEFWGIIICRNLRWSEHTHTVKNKIAKTRWTVQCTSWGTFLSKSALKLLYFKSLILPYLQHCGPYELAATLSSWIIDNPPAMSNIGFDTVLFHCDKIGYSNFLIFFSHEIQTSWYFLSHEIIISCCNVLSSSWNLP